MDDASPCPVLTVGLDDPPGFGRISQVLFNDPGEMRIDGAPLLRGILAERSPDVCGEPRPKNVFARRMEFGSAHDATIVPDILGKSNTCTY
jgi:hypothetical protein